MDEAMIFKVRNFGPINNADMTIGKINIVGGHNATGKSTASKLLYCFLKANSNKRQDFAYESLSNLMIRVMRHMGRYVPRIYEYDDGDSPEIFEDYEQLKEEFYNSDNYEYNKFFEKDVKDLDEAIKIINENGDSLYLSILRNLLRLEFSTRNFNGFISVCGGSEDNEYAFSADFLENKVNSDDAFKSKGSMDIYDAFYIDSYSIFDISSSSPRFSAKSFGYYDHVEYLKIMLQDEVDESIELFDEKKNMKIIDVEERIEEIINGKIEFNKGRFTYVANGSGPCAMNNTASGIKQIGVIQLLLSNRKLKEDSFLIIDEPEVNLHPEWQFKFAEILVLLAKELDITIYINTHSPMFIEAIEVLTRFNDLEEFTNFYLTEKFDGNTNNFIKYDYSDLYEIYDNLAKPFDAIEVYRLKAEYKKDKA